MKSKLLILTLAASLLGSTMVACGNAPTAPDSFALEAIDTTPRRYSAKEAGFQFRIDATSVLNSHKVTDISFEASKNTVTFQKVRGTGDDFLNYLWLAIPKDQGEFTVTAKIKDLKSTTTLTFKVLDPQYYDMTFNVPDGYKVTSTKRENTYVTTRVGDTYMIVKVIDGGVKPLNYVSKISEDKYDGWMWTSKTESWTHFGEMNKNVALGAMYLELYPMISQAAEYDTKETSSMTVDTKSYTVTNVTYSSNLGLESDVYSHYNGDDFQMVLRHVTNIGEGEPLLDIKVTNIETGVTAHPYDVPTAE